MKDAKLSVTTAMASPSYCVGHWVSSSLRNASHTDSLFLL